MMRHWPAYLGGLGLALACSSGSDSGVFASGGAAGADGGAAAGGTAGASAAGGTAGSAAAAGSGASAGTGATAGSAGDGGPSGCTQNGDCTGDPGGPVCDPTTGNCVGCLGASDCPSGQYCDTATQKCGAGCDETSDCAAPTPKCDTTTNQCAECLVDPDCPSGQICAAGACKTGCSSTQPCPNAGETCCGSTCNDLTSDVSACGTCGTACPQAPNATPVCNAGKCEMGSCAAGFADCNQNPADGCEHNVGTSGPCLCTPGATQNCYQGPAGTENVGICKGGTQTCLPSGLSYGPCIGQVFPLPEICANNIDDDCDGTADNVPDVDGDGWTACNGDCCEDSTQCSKPKSVNPGAFEFIGNGVDDDCDPATSDTTPVAACSTAAKFGAVTPDDVARAIDICQFTTANPPPAQKKWGVINASFRLANGNTPSAAQLNNMAAWQAAILANYGTGGIVPQNGPTMAGISSGRMRDQNDPGYVNPNSGTDFGSLSQPPAVYLSAHGGSLPASAGCSGNCPAGSGANDSINVRLQIRVPTNAQSLSYQFRFFSSEYWSWQCTAYNDFYLALLTTGAAGIPADKNISFDANNNPVSVNNGFFDLCAPKGCNTCPAGLAQLAGTGMQLSNTGGGTKWLTTTAPIVPGETMVIEFMVFDVSDGILDSLTILDNFKWSIDPSGVGTTE